jgi:hypothetical protein
MRTTLDLEKPVLEGPKELQKTDKRSLSKLASSLLAEALSQRAKTKETPVALSWTSSDMGMKLDLSDKEALYRVLDGE